MLQVSVAGGGVRKRASGVSPVAVAVQMYRARVDAKKVMSSVALHDFCCKQSVAHAPALLSSM